MKVKKTGILLAWILPVAIFGLFIWARVYSITIQKATYSEISKWNVVRTFIPPQAQKITATIVPYRMNIVAAFDITEEAFVAWANQRGWNLKEVEVTGVNNISLIGAINDSAEISSGWLYKWVYNVKDPGSTFRVYAYDRNNGVGYFSQSGD